MDTDPNILSNTPTTADVTLPKGMNMQQIAQLVYQRNAELVMLDKMKDEFVSLVSHELRTPLTIIKNYLWLVVNQDQNVVGEEAMKKIKIAIHSVDRLTQIVEDTLTVSRLENGKITLKKEPSDLVVKVAEIVEVYAFKAQEKNLKVIFEKPVDPMKTAVDINRLHEVLVNIYSNALKFTPNDGTIQITMQKSSDAKYYEITVKDTGPGIPRAKQHLLFTKFGKIDESYADLPNVNGTGLGLYISQQIMKLHGGEIAVQSEEKMGATFVVRCPIE